MHLVKLVGVVTIAGALAGCSVGFPISSSEIGSPPPDAARVIVYRPFGAMLMWRSLNVDVNGVPSCDLPRGGGFPKDVASGEVTVAVNLWDLPGKSSLSFMAETGKTYFVRVRVSGETSPGVKGGLFGLGTHPPEVAAGGSGPFDLDLTDESVAVASGVELRRPPPDAKSKMAC